MHRPLYLLAKASSNNLAFCLLAIVTSFEVFAQSAVGISRVGDTQERSLPQMQVQGAFSLGNVPNDKGASANNNFYFSDTLSLARGKHNLRLGTEIFRNQFIRNRNHLSRCPGVTYSFSGRSPLDKFGQAFRAYG